MKENEVGQAERLRREIWRLAKKIDEHPRADVCTEEVGGRILRVDDKRSLRVNYPRDEAIKSLDQANISFALLQRVTIIEARGGIERVEIYMEEYAEVFIFTGNERTRVHFDRQTGDERTGTFVTTSTSNFIDLSGGFNLDRFVLDEDGRVTVFEYDMNSPPKEMVDGIRTRLGQMKRWLAEVPRVRRPVLGKMD